MIRMRRKANSYQGREHHSKVLWDGLAHFILQRPYMKAIIVQPILQLEKLRHRDMKDLSKVTEPGSSTEELGACPLLWLCQAQAISSPREGPTRTATPLWATAFCSLSASPTPTRPDSLRSRASEGCQDPLRLSSIRGAQGTRAAPSEASQTLPGTQESSPNTLSSESLCKIQMMNQL